MTNQLKRTPLYENHVRLKARMVPFAGFEMPVQYQSVLEETKATRAQGGLFDVSHMGQFSLRGKNTLEALQPLVTNDLTKLKPQQAQYNFLLNETGGVIDDLIIYRRSEEETYICVNASNTEKDFEWMRDRLPKTVTFVNQSEETALIAAQGPISEKVLSELGDKALIEKLKYYYAVDTTVAQVPCFLSRTGYTGEDGFELYIHKKEASKLWTLLLEKGFKPCGLGARDILRLEMGYPLHGHELGPEWNVKTSGLSWVIKLNHEFMGKQAVTEFNESASRTLAGFKVLDRRIPRGGFPIADAKKNVIGEVTSGGFSPHLEAPIALGFIPASLHSESSFFVEIRNEWLPMTKVKLPFVPSKAKK